MSPLRDRLISALFAPGEVEEKKASGEHKASPTPFTDKQRISRVQRLSTEDLREWWDVTLASVWRHGVEFHKDWDPAHLEEIRLALPMLGALVDEIEKRHQRRIEAVETAGVARQALGKPDGV